VRRVWRALGLHVRRKKRRKIRTGQTRVLVATGPNQVWAYDFTFDRCANGQALKSLSIVDEWTRECLAIEVRSSLTAERVIEVLERLFEQYGAPLVLRSDNGPEFIARALKVWALMNHSETATSDPGKPWQNGSVENFRARAIQRGSGGFEDRGLPLREACPEAQPHRPHHRHRVGFDRVEHPFQAKTGRCAERHRDADRAQESGPEAWVGDVDGLVGGVEHQLRIDELQRDTELEIRRDRYTWRRKHGPEADRGLGDTDTQTYGEIPRKQNGRLVAQRVIVDVQEQHLLASDGLVRRDADVSPVAHPIGEIAERRTPTTLDADGAQLCGRERCPAQRHGRGDEHDTEFHAASRATAAVYEVCCIGACSAYSRGENSWIRPLLRTAT